MLNFRCNAHFRCNTQCTTWNVSTATNICTTGPGWTVPLGGIAIDCRNWLFRGAKKTLNYIQCNAQFQMQCSIQMQNQLHNLEFVDSDQNLHHESGMDCAVGRYRHLLPKLVISRIEKTKMHSMQCSFHHQTL
jgi:hypothetical protein